MNLKTEQDIFGFSFLGFHCGINNSNKKGTRSNFNISAIFLHEIIKIKYLHNY